MKTMSWIGAAAMLLVGAATGMEERWSRAAAPPLSPGAAQALKEPPERMSPALLRELDAAWAERARAFLRPLLDQPGDEIQAQVWIDQLAGKPYLHFKASGQNADYASDPRQNIVLVLFIGPERQDLDREFGDWFAPYEGDGQFIRPVEFGAERSAVSNITDDGTQNLYWQQDNAFVEVRSRGDVLELARRVHEEAIRTGIYNFPRSYLLPVGPDAGDPRPDSSPAPPETPETAPDAAAAPAPDIDSAPAPAPAPALAPEPPAQPTQAELAGGWERISDPPASLEVAEPPAPAATAPVASPRISASTLGLAIHAAVRRDEASPVAALIQAGADLEAYDSEGRTPLLTAAESASPAIIRQLVAAGADVEAVPSGLGVAAHDQGLTPLMFAARAGRTAAVIALVEAGASLTARSPAGQTALEIAIEAGHDPVIQVLRSASGESTAAGFPPEPDLPVVREESTSPNETEPTESPRATGPGITERGIESLKPSPTSTLVVSSIGEVRLWQARLEAAWKRMNVDINQDADASVLRALILDWDARLGADSTGATAYEAWRTALGGLSPEDPTTSPEPSAELSDEVVLQALQHAAASLRREFGSVEVPYSRKIQPGEG